MVMDEVERPLLECTMEYCGGNQTKAAKYLGLNRGTLRKKLKHHGLD
jgi:Fis family transcriptional regulator